jgi:hypothetical protein
MLALVIECNLMLAGTSLPIADKDMLIATLRFANWPYNGNNKLEMTTCFVLNKP